MLWLAPRCRGVCGHIPAMPVPAAPLAWALLIAISAVCARLPIPTRGNRALMRCCCRLASPHPVLTPPGRAHYPIKGCQPLGLIRRTRCVKELRARLDRLARCRFGCGMGELCANAWDSQAKARCADAQTHDLLQQNVTVGRRWLGRLRMAMR